MQTVPATVMPGLLDGIQLGISYPDAVSTWIETMDCGMLRANYFLTANGSTLTEAQKAGYQPFEVLKYLGTASSKPAMITLPYTFGAIGVAVGLFQALTSVQENTLTFVPKVAAMMVVFWVSMSFMTSTLVRFFTGTIVPMIAGS